jgi:ferric-dicitrate binding protein FerR (iron transport regulator)
MKTDRLQHVSDCNAESCCPGLPRRRLSIAFRFMLVGILALGASAVQLAVAAPRPEAPRAIVAGTKGANVELNGSRMASGATIFTGDVITLGADSAAALQFGKNQVLAASGSELLVEAEGVQLRNGNVQVRANDGNAFRVSGAYFRVNVGASQGAASAADIRVAGKRAQISATSGVANLTAAGNATPYELHAGEMATLDASGGNAAGMNPSAGPDAASPAAGQVSRLLPQVQIDRASQELAASLSDPVYWNDDLHSGATGRARIALQDGSLLNLGSNTSLRVLQHDAQAQQTSLDLAVGRLRGEVMKLTRPGAKFEIRTPAGVAGLVGTDFSLWVTRDFTELIVFDGAVRFTAAAGGQATTVAAGMKLLIPNAGAFEGPSPATPREMETAKNLTDVPQTPVQAAGRKNAVLVPVLVSLSVGGVALGVGSWLAGRDAVSPIRP